MSARLISAERLRSASCAIRASASRCSVETCAEMMTLSIVSVSLISKDYTCDEDDSDIAYSSFVEQWGVVQRPWPYSATPLERLAHRAGLDADDLREWLRAEITRRLRKLADTDPIEVECRDCGEPVEVSPSHYEKTQAGSRAAPVCSSCRWPTQAVKADAEAVRFVELLGDSVEGLAAAVGALR